ncbi:hypothetical protein F5144DRAFT_625685 [Chaetomium tenue]|uniref:Uncharacterized protein n=1 Tax=Chaetomium tenue TaxID=1854479 RepID=A0ACB7PT57_9PEZI|nr:hypothetical protein F5144DRAFT_625685 [Chaetomium globosum]
MASSEPARPEQILPFETKSTEASPAPKEPAPDKPQPANPPVRKFSLFTHLPSDIRTQIWSTAILRELGDGRPVPSLVDRPPMLKKGQGGGGWGRGRNPQQTTTTTDTTDTTSNPPPAPAPKSAPKPAPTASTAPKPPPRLHIIPFHKLSNEEPFTHTVTYLTARYGADWGWPGDGDAAAAVAGPSQSSEAAVSAWRHARIAEAEEAVRAHARSRLVLMPPGRAPGTGAQFSGGWCRGEVAGSCVEATAVADALGRWVNRGGHGGGGGGHTRGDGDGEDGAAAAVVGREALIDLGKGDVCCFVNVRADGSPIGWGDMLKFWKEDAYRRTYTEVCGQNPSCDHLSLFPGGEEWIGAAREGGRCDNGMWAGVSGLRGLLPALAQCEVLVGVWHPAMCMSFEEGRGLCSGVRRSLESLPVRYPHLKTIYIIDPAMKPKSKYLLSGLGKPAPKFRGRNATFYSALSDYFMSETEFGLPGWYRGGWRDVMKRVLRAVTAQLDPNRQPIQVAVLACVPDDRKKDPWGTKHE